MDNLAAMGAHRQHGTGSFADDLLRRAAEQEVIKGAMAGYVFENMEVASYTVLIAAATTGRPAAIA